ncbi:phosphoglucosamine mutase [Archaeoglobus fulgidus]|uniref:Phosphoglucosamine mutase n=4 Tax=Archaeoglobus fulgidus TaxID=2234 RepID=A0A075WI77_ARCFL|nr:phosphoglucosamine mutase [Archaeoglobus fulgidus]AIG97273.1 phosphoglucosamine mutase [Archaeoglobus fulgidus DSM 8774]KUJ93767.1 MAG: Phosphomannomutase (Pmm) [Archaeoglobus fulgidus]
MRAGGAGELFGTNGVRGIANSELTADMALNLGRTIGTLRQGKIAIACDTRISSSMLKSAVSAGIMSTGSDVVDIGIAPTPALQYYVKETDCSAGVIVTASHNPREYNGIKFVQENGVEFYREMDEESERVYMSKKFRIAEWSEVGQLYQDNSGLRKYIEAIINSVELDKSYRVAVDCGNGAGCFTTPEILKELGCDVYGINCNPDGRFPARNPEPVEASLDLLKKAVVDFRADFGVAHDGDADRAVFVDEKGNFVNEDVMLALMAKHYVEKNGGGLVVTPVSSSKCVEDAVKMAGGEIIYTAVGSPVVAKVMIEKKAVFGGEGNGGLIFPEHLIARDGGMSVAKVLELLDEKRKRLSELAAEIPRYHIVKGKVECREKKRLLEGLKEEFPEANHIDGARIDFEDGWVLIRPSGTEPIARVYAEAKTEDRARELYELGLRAIKKILG